MKVKRFAIVVGISLAVVMMLSMWGPVTVSAKECRLIKVTSHLKPMAGIAVEPETLEVSEGDCVFWANISMEVIKIRFLCSEESVVNPAGFECEKSKQSYITNYFKSGEARSVIIVKKGTYKYEIQSQTEPSAKTTGRIIVQ